MRVVEAEEVGRLLVYPDLVDALEAAFRGQVVTPVRHHHPVARAGEPDAMLLLMPAWDDVSTGFDGDPMIGIKIVNVVPGNAARGKASVVGSYLLMSGVTGEPVAMMDGSRLTLRRTAAASALAARTLARPDAARLVMVGAGALAPHLIEAHASVRPIREVAVWNHRPEKAVALAESLAGRPYRVTAVTDLAAAVAEADIVSAATLSSEPVIRGAWLKPGSHVDLVGAFTPAMRESDNEAVRRARVFVDTRGGALKEAGDIVRPIADGVITAADVVADLFDLCRGTDPGRRGADEITLFKSVGTALEDLAAARLVWSRVAGA
ncbi:ornithine cyclodeaminase family protein [Prosthecomicrobium hirschii]|uniref:ornithine cyclodeaminase family protein n=1 Tax=Prosthecodimorpha hirschii TaxID=665126 RepID=UPI0022200661|nr:ornithine cyclodeaminase family protein [Prosthecomicrobium hirschii]MCW1842154.1 ornithine cyclodeaminase family protein [Prosthecomicrobium hirschii]